MAVIQINVPYTMLIQRIDFVVEKRIHPEIYFSANDLDTFQEKDLKALAEKLDKHGLEVTIHGPFMDLSPGGVDPKIKKVTFERFVKTMEVARFLKPKAVVFHPGYDKWKFNGDVALWLESSLQTWRPLVEQAEENALVFAIENVYEENPDSLRQLLDEIDSPHFRFCFDTGHYHAFSMRKVPLHTWIETLKTYLCEVHLHDNHGQEDEHLPIGEGRFEFDLFFNLLSRLKLTPIYTIEPHREDHLWKGWEAAKKYVNPQ